MAPHVHKQTHTHTHTHTHGTCGEGGGSIFVYACVWREGGGEEEEGEETQKQLRGRAEQASRNRTFFAIG